MSNEFPAFIKAEYVEGDAFSRFQRDLQQATDGFKRKFTEAGQEAQRALGQALSIPRNSVGSLDLGVPQLRAAAEAQSARAIAAREVAAATALAAKAEGDYSANARAAITATQALAREEEEAARAARAHADAAEQVQRALNLQKSATDLVVANTTRGTTATRINTESQRANRFAMIQAGQQLQDITISLQSGQRATTVFAQQLPQLAFAFTDVGGKVGAFARVLAGPWGVAVFGAVTALGFLIEALVNSGSAAEKEAGALDFQITKVRELEGAIKKLNDAKVQQMQTSFEAERQALKEAESIRLNTIDTLKQVEAKIALAVANARVAAEAERNTADGSGGVAGRAGAQAGRDLRIQALQTDLAAAQKALAEAQRGVRVAERAATDSATDAALDPAKRVQRDFEKALSKEQKLMDAGSISAEQYARRRADITRAREAELRVIRETEKASRGNSGTSLPPVTGAEVARLIGAPITSGKRTAAQNRAVGGAANSLHLTGEAIDIPLTVGGKPLTKAGIRSALEGAGIKVREILGPGDKNHSDHFHVGFDRKRQRPDQMAGAAEREAEQAEKALEALAGRVQNLQDRFDPATKAANDFADALQTINDAQGAGIITERQSFDLQIQAMAEQAGALYRLQREETERFMKVFEPQQMRSAAEEWSDVVEDRWAASQRNAANEFVQAVQAADLIAALFSGRAGPQDLLRLINPNDSRMFTGANAKRSNPNERDVLGQFLYGKTSNFRELAEGKAPIQGGFAQEYTKVFSGLKDALSGSLEKVLGKDASKIGSVFGKVFAGAEVGSMTHDLIEGFGIKTSKLGSQIGGALGSAFGPIGSLIGSIVVGAGVEALKPTKRGSATIGGSNGNLIVSSTRGNSKARVEQSVETADEAITTLQRIADALGARLDTTKGAVSIGIRGDSFRVDTSGKGVTKTKKGAVDFGDDSAAAIKFATMDLIKDGVIQGLRASTQRVLQSSKDLETAIQRAVDFEGVFQELKERKDPIGAAIDTVEKEFTRLRDIFAQAGASTEEYASLEELYGLKRNEAVKEATERGFGSLKALLDDLKFGENGRSLRDRLAAAQANFNPLSARVQAGDLSAYDDFAEAARTLLDIQRQFSGSQTAFFDLQDQITAITAKAVEGGNVSSILAAGSSSARADAQLSYDGSNVVGAVNDQTEQIVTELRNLQRAFASGGGSSGGVNVNIEGFFAQNVRQI